VILLNIDGGLGNQLFQYAAGFSLALKHGKKLILCVDMLKLRNNRDFFLDKFLSERLVFCAPRQLSETIGSIWSIPFSRKIFYRNVPSLFIPKMVLTEKNFHDRLPMLIMTNHRGCIYMHGYWHSLDYFSDCAEDLRKIICASPHNTEFHAKYKRMIQHSSHSVSVHVRRGDYLNSNVLGVSHAICNLEYYISAINRAKELHVNCSFFFFSDDPNWVQENLACHCPGAVVVSSDILSNTIDDFILMNACDHHIISNSTFSWWAAWLNPSPSKFVIAPKKWLIKEPQYLSRILPSDWIVI
jgi:hypothetical protein